MDTKELIETFDDISSYFDQIRDYLVRSSPVKLETVEKLLSAAKTCAKQIKKIEVKDTESAMEFMHNVGIMAYHTVSIFDQLDIKLQHHESDVLSKTKAAKLMSQWQDIATIYRRYMRDWQSRMEGMAAGLITLVVGKPHEIQKLFHTYPMSIDLYQKYMIQAMDAAYKSGDQKLVSELTDMVEDDKSHALGERKYVSPFMTLGLYAREAPAKLGDIAAILECKSKTLSAIADEIGGRQLGLMVVYRHQPSNFVAVKPVSIDPSSGLTSDKLQPILVELKDSDWKWSIKMYNSDMNNFIVLESLGDGFRILTPWTHAQASNLVPRSRLSKVLQTQLGRPEQYFKLRDRQLSARWNPHVQKMAQRDPPKIDTDVLGLNRGRVVSDMLAALQESKGSDETRLADQAVWKAWQSGMLKDLANEKQISTLLYMLIWLEKQFKKDVFGAYKREKPSDVVLWFQSRGSGLLKDLIGRNDNIFAVLAQKQNIIDELSLLI